MDVEFCISWIICNFVDPWYSEYIYVYKVTHIFVEFLISWFDIVHKMYEIWYNTNDNEIIVVFLNYLSVN